MNKNVQKMNEDKLGMLSVIWCLAVDSAWDFVRSQKCTNKRDLRCHN